MKNIYDGQENRSCKMAPDERVVIVASRFNHEIMDGLLQTALDTLLEFMIPKHLVWTVRVPGAFEIPFAASQVIKRNHGKWKPAVVVALGCVIEGKTEHFRLIVDSSAQNLQLLGMETGIPIGFGILAVKKRQDAVERLHYARQAVFSAMEMYSFTKMTP